MNIYVIINGIEYQFPQAVIELHKDKISNYLTFQDKKNYFDISAMISDNQYEILLEMYQQCISSTEMVAMDIDDDCLAKLNKINLQFNKYINEITKLFQEQKYKEGYENLLSGLLSILEFYNNMIKDEEIIINKITK